MKSTNHPSIYALVFSWLHNVIYKVPNNFCNATQLPTLQPGPHKKQQVPNKWPYLISLKKHGSQVSSPLLVQPMPHSHLLTCLRVELLLEHLHCYSSINISTTCARLQLEGYLEKLWIKEGEATINFSTNERNANWKIEYN